MKTAHILCTAAVALVLAGSGITQDHPHVSFPNEIAAGDITTNSVWLWARIDRPGPVLFQLDRQPDFRRPSRWVLDFVHDPAVPAKVAVRGLLPDTRYHYRALAFGRPSVHGTFRTAAAAGARRGLRFGVSGDSRGELAPYPALRNADRRLDFFVALGDTVYADYASPSVPLPQATTLAEYRAKHAEVLGERFGLNVLGDVRRSTALFAVIDDHEVIDDFAGGASPATDPRFLPSTAPFINETPLYRNGLRAFVDYNPIADERYTNTGEARFDGKPDLYRYRRFGDDAAMFVLDARSFRDSGLPPVADPRDPAQVLAFLVAAFDGSRTMLGRTQLHRLQRDLLQAHRDGVTWKFVFVPEPIQNLGVIGASDRFEGYAAERSALLAFLEAQGIRNVVFVAADLHGTLVNNVTYAAGPGQPQIPTGAFEVITGAVAFDAPLGPTLISIAAAAGLLTPQQVAFYQTLPRPGRDVFVRDLVDSAIVPLGYDSLGLAGAPVAATLNVGDWVAAHTYGWTEFAIGAVDRTLTVTTWGIEPYTEADLMANPGAVIARRPEVVQQFTVSPR